MAATTGYQAGFETTQTQISYGIESAWGTLPATTFQAVRYMSESLAGSKQRDRPSEVPLVAEMIAAVTTKVQAGGGVKFALSYGTFDDWLSGALNNDWQANQQIAGVAADITITNGTSVLSSTTSNKFQNIAIGQFIRTLGFANAGNNNIWRVSAKASNQSITLQGVGTAAIVTETPTGTNAQVRASTITNASLFKSFYIQQKFASNAWLRYPGSFCTGVTLSGGVAQFLQGEFSFLSQVENTASADASTGGILAAPTGKVHDPVGGFSGMWMDGAALGATLDSFTIQTQTKNAQLEFGMGSSSAAGVVMGLLEVSGSFKVYFKDFSLYNRFANETASVPAIITRDAAGAAYVISLPNANIMNPQIEVGGPGTPVMATFQIEGNPQTAGGSIIIGRLDPT